MKMLFHYRQSDPRYFRERGPERRRQIRHPREVKLPLRIQRVVNLSAAICRLSHRRANLAQLEFRFAQQFHEIFPRASAHPFVSPNHPTEYRVSLLRYFFTSSLPPFSVIIFLSCQNNSPSSRSLSPIVSKITRPPP